MSCKEFREENGSCRYYPKTVFDWNIVAAVLHLTQGLIQLVFLISNFPDGDSPAFEFSHTAATWETTLVNETNSTCFDDKTCKTFQPRILAYDDRIWTISNQNIPYTNLNLGWSIIGFLLLSAFFQGLAACQKIVIDVGCSSKPCGVELCCKVFDYEGEVKQGRNCLRFIEYSISASLMLAVIAGQVYITDFGTIWLICVTCAITQILGLLSEFFVSKLLKSEYKALGEQPQGLNLKLGPWCCKKGQSNDERSNCELAILTHVAAWVAYGSAYGVILHQYYASNDCSPGDNKAPEFVTAIVWSQFALFSSFGLINFAQLVFDQSCCWSLPRNSEGVYILLSLGAKTLLCWLLFANVILEAVRD